MEPARTGRTVLERIPLPSDCCSIRQDPETGLYFYDYSVDGVFRTFTGYELSFLFFESYDGIRGRGFLNLARETIGRRGRRPAVRPEVLSEWGDDLRDRGGGLGPGKRRA